MAKDLLSSLIAQKDPKNETNNEVESNEEFKTPIGASNTNITTENPSTWEVDPKTSPPSMTSSPLTESKVETCSFCLEKEQKIADMIEEAKNQVIQSMDKALKMLPKKNNTFTKRAFKRVSDIPKLPGTPTPKRNQSYEIKSTVKRNTPKKSPRKNLLGAPAQNTMTPKSEKCQLSSPKRAIWKNYCSTMDRKSPMDNTSPMDRRSTMDVRSPLERRTVRERRSSIGSSPMASPMSRRNPCNRKTPQDIKAIRKDTPMPIVSRVISPQFKNTKLVKTSIPKCPTGNTVSSSTGSGTTQKTGIPSLAKYSTINKFKY